MFCPRCSQKQVSNEVRFCKGCGFPLADIAEALENNGQVSRNIIPVAENLKKDVTKGLVAITLSGLFFIISLILGTPEPSFFVQFNLLIGVLCYLSGLILIGHSVWKKSKEKPQYTDEKNRQLDSGKFPNLNEHRQESALRLDEPDLSQLADASMLAARNLKTNDLTAQPQSITEGTTKLLERE